MMKKSTHVKLAILLVLLNFACAISIQIDLSFDQAKQNTCLLQCTSISSQQCCFLFDLFFFNKLIPRRLCSLGKISFILSTKPINLFSFFSNFPSLIKIQHQSKEGNIRVDFSLSPSLSKGNIKARKETLECRQDWKNLIRKFLSPFLLFSPLIFQENSHNPHLRLNFGYINTDSGFIEMF